LTIRYKKRVRAVTMVERLVYTDRWSSITNLPQFILTALTFDLPLEMQRRR